jgi:hypothetical protein
MGKIHVACVLCSWTLSTVFDRNQSDSFLVLAANHCVPVVSIIRQHPSLLQMKTQFYELYIYQYFVTKECGNHITVNM